MKHALARKGTDSRFSGPRSPSPLRGSLARKMVSVPFLAVLSCAAADVPRSVCDVTAYGAKGDGKTLETAAIQKAINACAKAGGGTVYFPAGNFLSGTIVLQSNVTLNLSPGATLWGSKDIAHYNPPHLIYAKDAENIAIEGSGTINGNGDAFWEPDFKPKPKRPSPLIELVGCRHVRIENVRIRNTPGWGIHPLECDGVWIRGISMISDLRGPNTDGIDPDSSRNVMISDCYIETGDDAIVLKTTGRLRIPAPPCENVTVTNCVLISDDAALKLGTESHGDFRNCTFSNCSIYATRVGLAMYIKDGALVEGILFSNIAIDTSVDLYNRVTGSQRTWIEYPILIDLEKRQTDSRTGRIRDVSFSNLRVRGEGRVLVAGMPEQPLENFTFRNLALRVTGFEPVEKQRKPRGSSRVSPAPREGDYAPVPAALIFANIKGLDLRDMRVTWDAPGPPQDRHAIYAGRVEGFTLHGFAGAAAGGKLAAIGLEKAKDVFISGAADALTRGATYVHLPEGQPR